MTRTRRPGALCVLVLMALILVALPAVPGAADHNPPGDIPAGTGDLAGTESVAMEQYTGTACFDAYKTVFTVRGTGDYHGETATGEQVVYRAEIGAEEPLWQSGPLVVEIENTVQYSHGPSGTHGTQPNCAGAPGTPVPAAARIFAPDHIYRIDETGAQVPCRGEGSFARGNANGDINWRADWALSEDCVVVGNEAGTPGTGVAPAGTTHSHHGAHAGCGDVCQDNLRIDYAQYPAIIGPHLTMAGPASASVGDPVTINARLTDTGVPVPNAPVSFSVVGPAEAVPPTAALVTGDDGRAAFTFTATTAGDYTVTASASHAGEALSATHAVHFVAAASTMSLAGPSWSQTEENVVTTATLTNGGEPVPGASIDFAVAGPGQATPASQTAVTDAFGSASFTFSGDRAGDYTVTASTTHPLGDASAVHAVHLDINTFSRAGTITSPAGGVIGIGGSSEGRFSSAVMDPAGHYAYFGSMASSSVVKVELATFSRVGALYIGQLPTAAVVSPDGRYAYFATTQGRVVKVDLSTFQQVGAIDTVGKWINSAVMDPAGRYAYFGTGDSPGAAPSPGRVVKVDLQTFQHVGELVFDAGEGDVKSAVIDPAGNYAYFGASGGDNSPLGGKVVKVDLNSFQRVGVVDVPEARDNPYSELTAAVIDPAGNYAYFATLNNSLVKIDLNTFRKVAATTICCDQSIRSAVIDPAGRYAYFGTSHTQPQVVKIDLDVFQEVHALRVEEGVESAVIDLLGNYAYFGSDSKPGQVYKMAVSRPPNPALSAGNDAYSTSYATPLTVPAPGVLANDSDTGDGDPLTAHNPSDPAGGSITLRPDGSFTYTPDEGFAGDDTFTYTASDGMDYSAPATVTITVEGPEGLTGSAYGFYSSVSLFGGPAEPRGPDPSVTLPPAGSATPVTATAPTGNAVYGPADIFTSGQLDVATQGTSGPDGSVASSTKVVNVNRDGNEVFTAENVSSTCEATGSGVSATTSITNGTLRTSEGDPNLEGDETVVAVPANPAPNTVYEGQLESVGDRFEYIFNEQVMNPDGSITVYAAHQRLLGPTAIGDLYIGKAVCGMATTGGDTTTTTTTEVPTTTTTTTAPTTTTTAPTTTTTSTTVPPTTKARVADFDGDGDTDRSVFRNGAWYADGQPAAFFGVSGDIPVPGDYNGDGTTDRAVYRKGAWHIAGQPTVFLGNASDVPVPGDYDGNGTTEPAVYRNGAWYVAGQAPVFLGNASDIPVPGDYDGNGTTEAAVYRNGAWYVHNQPTVFHGVSGDIPVPGDYDANGSTDRAVYRKGAWYVVGQPTVFLGNSTDVPVPGDYNGDANTDRAVYRNGAWYVDGQLAAFVGVKGDVPLPLPHAIYRAFFSGA